MNPWVRSGPMSTQGAGSDSWGQDWVGIQGVDLHSGVKLGTQKTGRGMMPMLRDQLGALK